MDQIINTIKEYFADINNDSVDTEENLFENGHLDSMGIMELISFIEEKTGVTVEPDEIVEDNFKTINAISSLIKGKL